MGYRYFTQLLHSKMLDVGLHLLDGFISNCTDFTDFCRSSDRRHNCQKSLSIREFQHHLQTQAVWQGSRLCHADFWAIHSF